MWLCRQLRLLAGIALLPAVAGIALAIYRLMPNLLRADFPYVSREILALAAGFVAWTVLFLFVRVPDAVYVLGHELTHAAWALCTFQRVGRIRVSSGGGSCVVSNPGMFTTLAPYFIPFYLLALLALRLVLSIWIDMSDYALWWLAALGFAYGFHLTYTLKALVEVDQPDVREYGRVFSYVAIVAFNLLLLGLGLVWVTGSSLGEYGVALADNVADAYVTTWHRSCAFAKTARFW